MFTEGTIGLLISDRLSSQMSLEFSQKKFVSRQGSSRKKSGKVKESEASSINPESEPSKQGRKVLELILVSGYNPFDYGLLYRKYSDRSFLYCCLKHSTSLHLSRKHFSSSLILLKGRSAFPSQTDTTNRNQAFDEKRRSSKGLLQIRLGETTR